jgi:hypothetical protein
VKPAELSEIKEGLSERKNELPHQRYLYFDVVLGLA